MSHHSFSSLRIEARFSTNEQQQHSPQSVTLRPYTWNSTPPTALSKFELELLHSEYTEGLKLVNSFSDQNQPHNNHNNKANHGAATAVGSQRGETGSNSKGNRASGTTNSSSGSAQLLEFVLRRLQIPFSSNPTSSRLVRDALISIESSRGGRVQLITLRETEQVVEKLKTLHRLWVQQVYQTTTTTTSNTSSTPTGDNNRTTTVGRDVLWDTAELKEALQSLPPFPHQHHHQRPNTNGGVGGSSDATDQNHQQQQSSPSHTTGDLQTTAPEHERDPTAAATTTTGMEPTIDMRTLCDALNKVGILTHEQEHYILRSGDGDEEDEEDEPDIAPQQRKAVGGGGGGVSDHQAAAPPRFLQKPVAVPTKWVLQKVLLDHSAAVVGDPTRRTLLPPRASSSTNANASFSAPQRRLSCNGSRPSTPSTTTVSSSSPSLMGAASNARAAGGGGKVDRSTAALSKLHWLRCDSRGSSASNPHQRSNSSGASLLGDQVGSSNALRRLASLKKEHPGATTSATESGEQHSVEAGGGPSSFETTSSTGGGGEALLSASDPPPAALLLLPDLETIDVPLQPQPLHMVEEGSHSARRMSARARGRLSARMHRIAGGGTPLGSADGHSMQHRRTVLHEASSSSPVVAASGGGVPPSLSAALSDHHHHHRSSPPPHSRPSTTGGGGGATSPLLRQQRQQRRAGEPQHGAEPALLLPHSLGRHHCLEGAEYAQYRKTFSKRVVQFH